MLTITVGQEEALQFAAFKLCVAGLIFKRLR